MLAVHPDKQQVTVKHEDVLDYMPGMTMTFPVASPELMKGREAGELIVATLAVTDALGTLATIERVGFEPLPKDTNAAAIPGNLVGVGDEAPDAALIDQDNRRRALSEWRGSTTVITFIYTRCPLPNYCPLMDRHFVSIQRALASEPALAERVRLISVSFDPEYDTPAILAAHGKRLGADTRIWTFLTGDRVTLDRFAAKFGVGLIRPAGSQEITHNLKTVVVGRDGRIRQIYSGNEWIPSKVLADVRADSQLPE